MASAAAIVADLTLQSPSADGRRSVRGTWRTAPGSREEAPGCLIAHSLSKLLPSQASVRRLAPTIRRRRRFRHLARFLHLVVRGEIRRLSDAENSDIGP